MSERVEEVAVPARTETIVVGWNCDNPDCRAEIGPVVPAEPDRGGSASNPRDALPVSFGGYYGGYFDCPGSGPRLLLCRTCADALLEKFPYFAQAIERRVAQAFGIPTADETPPTK